MPPAPPVPPPLFLVPVPSLTDHSLLPSATLIIPIVPQPLPMCQVRLVRDKHTGTLYACKMVLRPSGPAGAKGGAPGKGSAQHEALASAVNEAEVTNGPSPTHSLLPHLSHLAPSPCPPHFPTPLSLSPRFLPPQVARALRHPHIVNLVEVIDDPSYKRMCLVMEYCEGGALMPDAGEAEPFSNPFFGPSSHT